LTLAFAEGSRGNRIFSLNQTIISKKGKANEPIWRSDVLVDDSRKRGRLCGSTLRCYPAFDTQIVTSAILVTYWRSAQVTIIIVCDSKLLSLDHFVVGQLWHLAHVRRVWNCYSAHRHQKTTKFTFIVYPRISVVNCTQYRSSKGEIRSLWTTDYRCESRSSSLSSFASTNSWFFEYKSQKVGNLQSELQNLNLIFLLYCKL
jgi:hypothetical protein